MWYILENQPGSKVFTGFASKSSRELFEEALAAGTIPGMLNTETSRPGDVFFTPAGRIHAIGAGNLLVEIQQTSDITYRIFDWNRKNPDGTERELHNDLSPEALDFSASANTVIRKEFGTDSTVNLVSCEYFVTNILHFNSIVQKDYNLFDSFIIYICLSGEFLIHWDTGTEIVKKGETVLLPAMITDVALEPRPEAKLLEVFINSSSQKNK
jgi:mannose-6-phosphate isomerase